MLRDIDASVVHSITVISSTMSAAGHCLDRLGYCVRPIRLVEELMCFNNVLCQLAHHSRRPVCVTGLESLDSYLDLIQGGVHSRELRVTGVLQMA